MKNILYICNRNPFDPISGNHQRTNLLCRALAEIACVDVVSYTDETVTDTISIENCNYLETIVPLKQEWYNRYLRLFLSVFLNKMPILRDKYFSQRLRKIISNKRYDYIVVRYIPTLIQGSIPLANNIIIDIDDLPEQTYQWLAEKEKVPVLKNLRHLQVVFLEKAARIHTRKLVKNVNHVFLANKNQIVLFSNASYLPNIPYPFFTKNIKNYVPKNKNLATSQILFVGMLSFGPNIFGIEHFLDNIWNDILEYLPQAHFNIVGSSLKKDKKQQWESYRQVRVIGFTDDLMSEYEKNDVVIVPIYQGAGTNIKVLEAMYTNMPCVITQHASRGFEDILIDKQNVLIAQTDIEFADKVIAVLKDKNLNTYIKMNAYKTIENNFSYNSFRQAVHEHIH